MYIGVAFVTACRFFAHLKGLVQRFRIENVFHSSWS